MIATASLIFDGAASSAAFSTDLAASTAVDGSLLRSFSTPASAWFTSSKAWQKAVGCASAGEVVAAASALPSSSPPHAPNAITATTAHDDRRACGPSLGPSLATISPPVPAELRTRRRAAGDGSRTIGGHGESCDPCAMTTIYYERDADLAALAGATVAVVGYGNQGRSWALNLRDSGCAPVVCVRRDETREQAEADGFEAHDLEAANDADVICILVPDDVIPLAAARARADSCVIVASGYTLGVRPPRPARRQRDGRAAHARPRGAPLLRGGRRLHHRGRRAPRRDRRRRSPACSRSRRRSAACARVAIELTPMQEAVLDLGGRAGAVARAHRRQQRVRADDDRARHPDRGDRRRARAVGRGRAHVPVAARGRLRGAVRVPLADEPVRPADAARSLRPPRLRGDDARARRRHRVGPLRRRVGRRARRGLPDAHAAEGTARGPGGSRVRSRAPHAASDRACPVRSRRHVRGDSARWIGFGSGSSASATSRRSTCRAISRTSSCDVVALCDPRADVLDRRAREWGVDRTLHATRRVCSPIPTSTRSRSSAPRRCTPST